VICRLLSGLRRPHRRPASPTWNAFRLAPTHETWGKRAGVHELPQFVVALAEVDTLYTDAAANAVDDRVGAMEARAAEIMALRDAGVTPGGYLVALDYFAGNDANRVLEAARVCQFATVRSTGVAADGVRQQVEEPREVGT
jgi:hypothetical protein